MSDDLITAGRYTTIPKDLKTNVHLDLGAFCSIASGVSIVSGQHPGVDQPRAVSNFPFLEDAQWRHPAYPPSRFGGGVFVGSDVWIGEGATILEGVSIQHGAVIGARAMVVKDVPPYAVVVGNPGTVKKYRFDPDRIAALLRMEWWDWADEKIHYALPLMGNVDDFIRMGEPNV